MSTQVLALVLFSWVFFLSLGFALGFYWLKTQLESKMTGMFDLDSGLDFESDGGEFFDE